MAEEIFKTEYDVTKKSKIRRFYESNKILIYSFIFAVVISLGSFSFYLENKEKKKILLSDNYLQAKIYLEDGQKNEALNILKENIYANDSTYSVLSFFLILSQNLIIDDKEISNLFNHVLKNNNFSNENRSLLIYKKIVFESNYLDESELLEAANPLLNSETAWRPHILILLGDYFMSKGANIKAIDFYQKILTIKNLNINFYNHARSQLEIISNE